MIDAESEAVKISKLGSGKSHSGYPNPKSQYPPPPRVLAFVLGHQMHIIIIMISILAHHICSNFPNIHYVVVQSWCSIVSIGCYRDNKNKYLTFI